MIAVALFAALSYAVSNGMRGGGDIVTDKQAELKADQILQYASRLKEGVSYLIGYSGCSESQISFWHDSNGDGAEDASDEYFNSNSPTNKRCHLFNPNGAGLNHQNIGGSIDPTIVQRYAATGARTVEGIGTDDLADIYFSIYEGSNQNLGFEKICENINSRAGIEKTGLAPSGFFDPATTWMNFVTFTFPYTGENLSIPFASSRGFDWLNGSRYFCVGHAAGKTLFSFTLLER